MHRRIDRTILRHLLLRVLAILVFTTQLASSQNTASPPALSSSSFEAAAQCPVSVQYNVNLGQGQDTALVPIFVATITITNNQEPAASTPPNTDDNSIQSWRMGWKFPYNSTIKTPGDVFDPTVVLLTPDSVTPVLEEISGGGDGGNSTTNTNSSSTAAIGGRGIAPGESRQFGFLGTKGGGELSATNPYNVGAITGMVFNNLLCTMISSPQQQLRPLQQLAAPDAVPGESITGPTQLEIQYTPIQYRDEPLINTFTQFLVRVRNIGNGSTLDLPSIGLQYWFQGPEGFVPPAVEASPWDYFEARCEWSTIGCESVKLGISTGYTDVSGARFAVNVTLAEDAGPLLPSGDAAVPALFLGQEGIDVLDLLLTLTTKAGVVLLNSTQDYSFLDTLVLEDAGVQPQQPQQQQRLNTTTTGSSGVLVPRKAQPNERIPAYINGQLAWGILPSSPSGTSLSASEVPASEGEVGGQLGRLGGERLVTASGEVVQLPEGVFCESIRGGTQQSCTLQAVYCCVSVNPQEPGVSTTIPAVWPPTGLAGDGGGEGANSSSDTGSGPSPINSTDGTTLPSGPTGRIVPGQEDSNTPAFFPPLPEPGAQNQIVTGEEQQPENLEQSSGGGGSIAWIAGIAVGVAIGGVVGGGFLIAWRRKRNKRRRDEHEDETKNLAMLHGGGSNGKDSSSNGTYTPASITVVSSDSPLSWQRSAFVPPASVRTRGFGGGFGGGSVTSAGTAGGSPHYPLVNSPAGAGLYKYPSGISGTSSSDPTAVLDSTFNSTFNSDGANTNTLPNSPFIGNSALGGGGISATLMHGGIGAIMEARNEEGHGGGEESASVNRVGAAKALPSNVLQLLERKARTCPGSLFAGTRASNAAAKKQINKKLRREQHRRATEGEGGLSETPAIGELTGLAALDRLAATRRHSNKTSEQTSAGSPTPSFSSSSSDSDSEEDEGDVFNSNPDIEPWQLRRSTSWDGILQDPHSSDSLSQIINLKRRRTAPQQLPAPLPPLSPLPSPLLPSLQGPGPGIDLDVDPSEIMGSLGRCLGTGGFGSVYEAEWRGKKVAVKMLPSLVANDLSGGGDAAYQALLREIQLASKFDSDRLVKVYGACTRDKNHCCLIMELAENGSLFYRIHDKRKRRLSYLEILQLGHDIACGLAYLHPAVVHRDLKPQNVLLDLEGRAKLADFGISRIKDPTKSYFSQVTAENGTPMYMSPESMNGTRVDEKVDVYALGVILNEAWTRRQPWKDSAHFFQIILKVAINGERPWMDPDCPEPLKRLITKCWHQDPRQRPSCADVMRLTDLLMQDELRKYEELRKWEKR